MGWLDQMTKAIEDGDATQELLQHKKTEILLKVLLGPFALVGFINGYVLHRARDFYWWELAEWCGISGGLGAIGLWLLLRQYRQGAIKRDVYLAGPMVACVIGALLGVLCPPIR